MVLLQRLSDWFYCKVEVIWDWLRLKWPYYRDYLTGFTARWK